MFSDPATIHACLLQLPGPINLGFAIAPALAAGKRYLHFYCLHEAINLDPGGNAVISKYMARCSHGPILPRLFGV